MKVGEAAVPVSFTQDAQNWLEVVRMPESSGVAEVQLGSGRLIWAAYPTELAEGFDATVRIYDHALRRAGVAQIFRLEQPLSNGVLVFPVIMADAVLYVLASDAAQDAHILLRDKVSAARVSVRLGAERGAMLLLDKKTGSIITRYGQ